MRRSNRTSNLKIMSYYVGYVILTVSALMLIPIFTALIFQEWRAMLDFMLSLSISVIIGSSLVLFGRETLRMKEKMQWKHGFAIASGSWIFLMVLCAIPYRLSGHSLSMVDACFDVMSGFTTTGLSLTQDLDHLSVAMNMWRHLITFLGGQGMVVLALTFLTKGVGGGYKMYVGEGKDIELLPNVINTTKIIWKISVVYLVIGTSALWLVGILIGLAPGSAFLHGLYMFESGWSTGGFSPNTQNMMYYHSLAFETVSIIIFILGSLNFGIHYAVWEGNKKEIYKNIEVQSFVITSVTACLLAMAALSKNGIYPNAVAGFRKVVFNVLSAHTTTGFGNVYARQFKHDWGEAGALIMILVMLIGGSACSTAGGFKGLRLGLIFHGVIADVKKLLHSERSVKVYKYHYMKDRVLEDPAVKAASLIVFCYLSTFLIGTIMGTFYNYSLVDSAFEAASIAGNVGLSIGVTAENMPLAMKVYYIIAMYLGRLEFLSAFALVGMMIGGIRQTCKNIIRK